MGVFAWWKRHRDLKKFWARQNAVRARLEQGPLTEAEHRIVELLCAGDDRRFEAVREAYTAADSIERIPGFSLWVRTDPAGLQWNRGGYSWYPKDLVILDKRVGALRVSVSGGGVPFTFQLHLNPLERLEPEAWPPSLQADDWGYLAEGEEFDGTVPQSKARTMTDFGPKVRKPGRAAAWLAELVEQGGEAVSPAGAGSPENLTFEAPREVAQFYRWSDGAEWGGMSIASCDELIELDELPGIVVFGTDDDGNGRAFDLTRANATSCPIVQVTNEVDFDLAPNFRTFLKATLDEGG